MPNREKAKKVRLPLYWVGHIISCVFGGKYTRHYRDADNNLTFVVQRDSTDWSQVFPSAKITDIKDCAVVWIVFEKNKRHWHYAEKEA